MLGGGEDTRRVASQGRLTGHFPAGGYANVVVLSQPALNANRPEALQSMQQVNVKFPSTRTTYWCVIRTKGLTYPLLRSPKCMKNGPNQEKGTGCGNENRGLRVFQKKIQNCEVMKPREVP